MTSQNYRSLQRLTQAPTAISIQSNIGIMPSDEVTSDTHHFNSPIYNWGRIIEFDDTHDKIASNSKELLASLITPSQISVVSTTFWQAALEAFQANAILEEDEPGLLFFDSDSSYETSQPDMFVEPSWHGRSFEPSSELIAIIDRGIKQYVSEYKTDELESVIAAFEPLNSEETKKRQFTDVLLDLVSTIAFFQLDGILEKKEVTQDHCFNIIFQNAFLDSFPLAPIDVMRFQSHLRRELISYLLHGGEIKGDWGHLTVQDGELIIDFNDDNRVSSEDTAEDWELATPIDY